MKGPLYRSFFGFQREPYTPELEIKEILATQALEAFTERFDYVLRLGAIGLLTGEVGAGENDRRGANELGRALTQKSAR